MPKYLLTNEVIVTELWKMLKTNPAYSEDLTTKAKPGKSAVCTYFKFRPGVQVTVGGDFPNISLAKSGWRTGSALNGSFASGTWTFKIRLENDTKYAFSVKVAVRLSRSVNADGSNATLIIVSESPNVLALPAAAGGSVSDTWTWNAPAVTLTNEYLFAEYRIHIEVAGTSTSCQCSFACDEDPAVADESITTTTFTFTAIEGLYTGCVTTPGKIVKLDPATFVKLDCLTLDTGENNIYDLIRVGDFLYALLFTSPFKIVKINLPTFEKVATLTSSLANYAVKMDTDGTYLYTVADSIPNKVVRIRLSDFTEDSILTLASAEQGTAPDILKVGNYLYVQTSAVGLLVKVDLTTFTRIGSIDVRGPYTGHTPQNMGLGTDGFLYVGMSATDNPNYINKIDLATFSVVTRISYPYADGFPNAFVSAGNYLYIGTGYSVVTPAKIKKIDLPTFSIVDTLTLDTGENYIRLQSRELEDSAFAYFGLDTTPGKIVRINLATFTKDTTITLNTGENTVDAIVKVYPAIIETIVAKTFPMEYLESPAKAKELKSKVSGATITKVAKDFPETMHKSGKSKELRSKWS